MFHKHYINFHLKQLQLVLKHELLAQDHGQELVVGDVLCHRGHNVSRLLENCLVVPVRINASQLTGYP